MVFRPVLPLTLTEVGGQGRVIVFTGPDLPLKYPRIMGSVRGQTTWYAGSRRASVQILGPREDSLPFEGAFEDRKTGIPGQAVVMMELIQSVRRAAYPVRWEYGPISLLCRWSRTEFEIEELERIHYRIELEIVDAEEDRLVRVSPIRRIPGVDAALEAANVLRQVLDVLPITSGPVGKVKTQADRVLGGLGRADDLLAGIRGAGTVIRASNLTQALNEVRAASVDLRGAHQLLTQVSWENEVGDDFQRVTETAFDLGAAHQALSATAVEVQSLIPQLERVAVKGSTERIYVTRAGETLQRIALAQYGAASSWTAIAERNGLDSATVSAGQVLVLPDAPTP